MANVTLAKALNVKNKLAGEINLLQQRIQACNTYVDGKVGNFDVKKMMAELFEKKVRLIAIKTAISTANTAIYDKIERVKELKGDIVFLGSVPCREHKDVSGYGEHRTERVFDCVYKDVEIAKMVEERSAQIEQLQDEINYFNNTTKIDIP